MKLVLQSDIEHTMQPNQQHATQLILLMAMKQRNATVRTPQGAILRHGTGQNHIVNKTSPANHQLETT